MKIKLVKATTLMITLMLTIGLLNCSIEKDLMISGSLNLKIANKESRTLLPELNMEVSSYKIIGNGPMSETFSKSTTDPTSTIDNLIVGEWTITVIALNKEGIEIGLGSESVTIQNNVISDLTIGITPLSGTGSLDLKLNWTNSNVEMPKVVAILTTSKGEDIVLDFTVDGTKATCNKTDIENGYYTLKLQLLDDKVIVFGTKEVVRIVSTQATKGLYAYDDRKKKITGSINTNIELQMSNPLAVLITGAVYDKELEETITLIASVKDYSKNVTYNWSVNGVTKGIESSFTLDDSWPIGSYNISVTVFSSDELRAGSEAFNLNIVDGNNPSSENNDTSKLKFTTSTLIMANEDTTINLDANNYFDPIGDDYDYTWDFFNIPNSDLNLTPLSGKTCEFKIPFQKENVGIYSIDLIVRNKNGDLVTKKQIDVSVGTIPVDLTGYPNASNTGIKALGLTMDDLVPTGSLHLNIKGDTPRIGFGGGTALRWFDFDSEGKLIGNEDDLSAGNIYLEGRKLIIKNLFINDGLFMYQNFWANNLIDECLIEGCLIKSKNSNTKPSYGISLKATPREADGDVVIRTIIKNCTLFNELEVRGENPHATGKAILARDCVVESCDISGFADGIFIGSNTEIINNYIHDLHAYNPKWDGINKDGTHSDGIQTTGGYNTKINGNTIDTRGFYNNSAIIIQDMAGDVSDLEISNNYLLGGQYTVYINDRNDGYIIEDGKQVHVHTNPWSVKDIKVTNNYIYNVNEDHVLGHTGEGNGHPIGGYIIYEGNKTHKEGSILSW